jgi:hypothetical protein
MRPPALSLRAPEPRCGCGKQAATQQDQGAGFRNRCRRAAAEGEVVDGKPSSAQADNLEAADICCWPLDTHEVASRYRVADFKVRLGKTAECEIRVRRDDLNISQRGIQPKTDFGYLRGEEYFDHCAAAELGREVEIHGSQDRGSGFRIARDPSGKLVQGWFVPTAPPTENWTPGIWLKNGNRLRRAAGDTLEIDNSGARLKCGDNGRIVRIDNGGV